MKNVIIALLAIIVIVMGYLLFTNTLTPATNTTSSPSPANTQAQSTSGKTLNLSSKGLSSLDKNMLDNASVTTLDVSGNNLTGALPAEIRKLTNLEVLNASNNKMTGIPAEIGQLSKLRTANFSNNDISGLPLEIGNLKNLVTLDLRGNPNISKYDIGKIQGQIPNATILTD